MSLTRSPDSCVKTAGRRSVSHADLVFALGTNTISAIHGDKQQNERDWVLNEFKTGKAPIMVATDVASRGIGMITHPPFPLRIVTSSCPFLLLIPSPASLPLRSARLLHCSLSSGPHSVRFPDRVNLSCGRGAAVSELCSRGPLWNTPLHGAHVAAPSY